MLIFALTVAIICAVGFAIGFFDAIKKLHTAGRELRGVKVNRDYYRRQAENLQRRFDSLWSYYHPPEGHYIFIPWEGEEKADAPEV